MISIKCGSFSVENYGAIVKFGLSALFAFQMLNWEVTGLVSHAVPGIICNNVCMCGCS